MQLDDLYRRVIMDHYKKPRNYGMFIEDHDDTIMIHVNNPACGDRISLQLQVNNDMIQNARFTGEGCSISLSSASMMTDAVKGKTLTEAFHWAERFFAMVKGDDVTFDEYEDIEALSGVCKFPARIKCATLPWNALQQGIENLQ